MFPMPVEEISFWSERGLFSHVPARGNLKTAPAWLITPVLVEEISFWSERGLAIAGKLVAFS
jgi:hypothetical protein